MGDARENWRRGGQQFPGKRAGGQSRRGEARRPGQSPKLGVEQVDRYAEELHNLSVNTLRGN